MDGRAGRVRGSRDGLPTARLGSWPKLLSQLPDINSTGQIRRDPQCQTVLVVVAGENRRKDPTMRSPAAAGSSRALSEPINDGLGTEVAL